ncbi:polymer-forming cytoskeletal protein [Histophilus somni]|uniref:polymer-forming cytoskeletal protein n=1 Tax=Histophilus somni TaxID=731 RepID=UPI00201EAFAB|nr:polymer-forming cytoskeletal protein [Histophilus somni]
MEGRKKYELVREDTVQVKGITLYRIKALIDFYKVRAGDLGGYIQDERNLSHDGNAWVADNAMVYDNARVLGNAKIQGNAVVYNNAFVYDNAIVRDDTQVRDNAEVCEDAIISEEAWITENAKVRGTSRVRGDGYVFGNAMLVGDVVVYGNAKIRGNVWLRGTIFIGENAYIQNDNDFFVASNVGTEYGTLTVYKTEDGLYATRGCFCGSVEEFLKRSKENHDEKTHNEYKLLVKVARSKILG